MTVLSQEQQPATLSKALAISSVACISAFALILGLLGFSLVPAALAALTAGLLWLAYRYPLNGMGACLAFMPVYTLVYLLARFFGPSYIGMLEGCDRVAILLFAVILWKQNKVKLELPDWLLTSCFAIAAVHLIFAGGLIGLLTDFNFMIAYAAGRVTILDSEKERLWAKRAVWILAVIAVLGMLEVFWIGEGPRTMLYLSLGGAGTQNGALDNAFHGTSYTGLRESATMFGPLQFAPLCMAALVIWWVYSRDPIPGAMIAAGLVCSVTRSAWLGTAVAMTVLAFLMGQTKRLFQCVALMLALFAAAIPILGLSDYLTSIKSGEDPSAQGHSISILEGLQFVAEHPIVGTGPATVGRWAVKGDTNALSIEDTYLTIAAQYGIPALLCFVGFLGSALRMLWRERTPRAYAAIGIITGFGTVMTFAALHDVFPLACWLWFPVGLAIRSVSEKKHSMTAAIEVAESEYMG